MQTCTRNSCLKQKLLNLPEFEGRLSDPQHVKLLYIMIEVIPLGTGISTALLWSGIILPLLYLRTTTFICLTAAKVPNFVSWRRGSS